MKMNKTEKMNKNEKTDKTRKPGSRETSAATNSLPAAVKTVERTPDPVLDAFDSPLCNRLKAENNFLVAFDEVFGGVIVYAYCSKRDFCELYEKLYGERPAMKEAHAYCFHGEAKEVRAFVEFIWVNSIEERPGAIPVFMHEIVHLADNLISHAGVKDSAGELIAHLVERETRRVLRHFYGIGCNERITLEQLSGMLK